MRQLLLLVLAVAMLPLAPTRAARAEVPIAVIDGRGFGHGVGMAQEGARSLAARGSTTQQILAQFYPGTSAGRASGPVRVPVFDAGAGTTSALLSFPNGGEVREAGGGPSTGGFPVRVPAGAVVRVTFDGSAYRVEQQSAVAMGRIELVASTRRQVPGLPSTSTSTTSTTSPPDEPPDEPPPSGPLASTTTTTAKPATTTSTVRPKEPPPREPAPATVRPLTAVPPDGGTVALPARNRRYRGMVEVTAASGRLRLINVVDVEHYLKGMGEIRDPTWPPAALRAQAIAARTYALRAMTVGGEICDTQRCQVYLGAQAEYGAMNAAVDATAQQVLTFERRLASAVYSANGGGHSATREEGFGVSDSSAPYLRAAPYFTSDPGSWSVSVSLADVAARLGYGGNVSDVRVARSGPSGRALEVVLDGDRGPKAVTGLAFDAALGLRSTLFAVRVTTGDAPPPPPPEEVSAQAPPEEAAAVAGAPAGPAAGLPALRSSPPIGGDRYPFELAVVAGWLLTAVAGLIALTHRTMLRPWPSVLRTADGSPSSSATR